ncbi:MAG TPA: arylesterase [Cyclobacteriaceae bacterium]|nr:arylesterase [Cyclobacteriaceae bacterium]HRJ83186.1 arylesterase [Cyclobacteriaceae bacterium]
MVGKFSWIIVSLLFLQGSTTVKTIMFYGDSLTAGYGLSTEEAFPALLEKKLNAQSTRCKVINAGLSGETSAGGLSRIDWVLRQPVDIFVLELGGNDGLRGLPLEQTKANLQAIIDKVKVKNPTAKIVVAGMMVPPNMGRDYTTQFKDVFPELAKKNRATLIPFLLEGVGGNEKLNLPDGIHPNVEGHKIIADNLVKVIGPLL